MKYALSLVLLLVACGPINHMLGRQANKGTVSMYFNGTVIEEPVIISGEELIVKLKTIGEDGQIMTIICEKDAEVIKRCLEAHAGMQIKANGSLANRETLVLRADYFAKK